MKLELESTGEIIQVDGHRARVWIGTYRGTPVVAFVSSIAVLDGPACEDFARELAESKTPPVLLAGDGQPFEPASGAPWVDLEALEREHEELGRKLVRAERERLFCMHRGSVVAAPGGSKCTVCGEFFVNFRPA